MSSSNSGKYNKQTTTSTTSTTTNTPNELVLQSTIQLQDDTKRVLESIQSSLVECEMIGCTTLVTLDEDNYKTSQLLRETSRLNEKLETTRTLQDRYAVWSFHWKNTTRKARRQLRNQEKENKKQRKIQQQEEQLKQWEQETKKKTTNTTNPNADVSKKCTRSITTNTTPSFQQKNPSCDRNDKELLFKGCHQSSLKRPGGCHDLHGLINNNNTNFKGQQPPSQQDQLTHPERSMLENVEYINDVDIDTTLDGISNQMEQLLNVSNTIHDSITTQNTKLSTLENELNKVDEKQAIINYRHLRFMSNKNKRE